EPTLLLWSPDSKTLAVQSTTPTPRLLNVSLYDAATGKVRTHINYYAEMPSEGILFTPDSSAIVIQSDKVGIYSATDGKLLREFADNTESMIQYEQIFYGHEESSQNADGSYSDITVGPSNAEKLKALPTRYLSNRIISPDGRFILVRAGL